MMEIAEEYIEHFWLNPSMIFEEKRIAQRLNTFQYVKPLSQLSDFRNWLTLKKKNSLRKKEWTRKKNHWEAKWKRKWWKKSNEEMKNNKIYIYGV